MARVVIPELLTLRLGSLPGSASRFIEVEQKLGTLLRKRKHDTREPGIPVSLRWTLNPVLGFPRGPFEVWRRTRKEEPTTAILGAVTLTAPTTVDLPLSAIELRFNATPGGSGLMVEALNASGKVLPGQRLLLTTPGGGRFRAAGISRLRLSGTGSIADVGALVQRDWANLSDWDRIELVGFPFDAGLLASSGYDPGPQGWEPASLPGPDAAAVRMVVAEILQLDPPPAGPLTVPPWPFPDPGAFLSMLKPTLEDVADCFATSVDSDPAHQQADHAVTRTLPGLRQPGQTPGDPADIALPTTAFVALAVQDAPVSVALGFGTIDTPGVGRVPAPKDVLPPGTELGLDEYMVTAKVETLLGTYEIAAIGHREPAPPAFAALAADDTFVNRPLTRDTPESRTMALSWASPLLQAGAGLLTQHATLPTVVLNTPRPAAAGGFQPYLTEYRLADDGFPPIDLRPTVTVPDEIAPLSGSAAVTYAVAPIDVHGRWGPWTLANHTLTAPPVQQPGIGSVDLALPAVLPASGPVAAGCSLVVELLWDWSDRSPDRIELAGGFVPAGPPPASVAGFQPDSTQPALTLPLTVAFSPAGAPSIAVPPVGSPPAAIALAQGSLVAEVSQTGVPAGPPAPGSTGSQVRRYRVTVPLLSVSFSTSDVVGFAVSAQAAEQVRPTELSAPTGPRATSVRNPFPAPPPTMPAVTVLWTAQADATGRARTVLGWPAVAGATGYIVWEATETALSVAVGGTPVTGAIRTRAADLKARVAANQDASLSAFSRLNETPIAATSIELELPGSADTLFAYRVASITSQNVESARSAEIVLVGVPHRDTPGTPHLEATPTVDGVLLTVVAGAGSAPAGLRIHRVRRPGLAQAVGTMGPPVLEVATTSLTTVPVPVLAGPPQVGWQFLDAVDPSWTPYVYRVVAVGTEAPDDGVRAGSSPPSGIAEALLAPPLPPLLVLAPAITGTGGVLLGLQTDLPVRATPGGPAELRIAAVAGATRTAIGTLDPATIPEGPALGAGTPPGTGLTATRRAPVAGVSDISILVAPQLVPAGASLVVTATDPRGRSTSAEVG
jgi:hypothetical protein